MLRKLLFVALFAPVPMSAQAQTKKPSAAASQATDAARLKASGDAFMDQDKYADALSMYIRAYELSNDPALLYNMGRALEALGDYPEALDRLEQFDREASPALRARVPALGGLLTDLRGRISTIVVTTNAPGARLFVREKSIGSLEEGKETRVRTRAGSATIEVSADGYESLKKSVELPPGATLAFDGRLLPRARDALLVITTTPSAFVTLDGRSLGKAPIEQRIAPGAYRLVATADGYEEEKQELLVAVGERRAIDFKLEKSSSVIGRWWFWTGLGVLVAGGVVTAIALSTERSPDEGTFGPGSLPAPAPR